MSEIHIGPHTRDEAKEHDVTETFDREINVKAIAWMVGGLVAATVVIHLLMLWMVEGFERFDKKRDVRPTPIEAAMPQGPPPGPLLQIDDNKDLIEMRQAEDRALTQPAWADRAQGRVRVPIEDAMEVIARRGLGADVVGGTPHPPGPPLPSPPQPSGEGGKGQSQINQSTRSVSPLPVEGGVMGEGPGVRGPAPQERPL